MIGKASVVGWVTNRRFWQPVLVVMVSCLAGCSPQQTGDSPDPITPPAVSTAPSGELQLPEERLYELHLSGSVEAARAGFRELIQARREVVDRSREETDESLDGLGRFALAVGQLSRAIEFYQLSEVRRLTGGGVPAGGDGAAKRAVPPQVADDLVRAFAGLGNDADELVRQRQAVAAGFAQGGGQEQRFRQDWRVRDAGSTIERAGRELYRGVLLLRGSSRAAYRAELLNRARRLTAVPASLEEIDRRQVNLRREFGIEPGAPGGR